VQGKKIRDANIWVIYAAILLLGVAYGTSISVLAIHMDAYGLPKERMGWLAAAFALGIITFSMPAGGFVQRVGAKTTLLVALLGYAACVASFPFPRSIGALALVRFVDGACSAAIWVSAETALLARAEKEHRAYVMSLYAISLALGYVIGPLLSTQIVSFWGTSGSFLASGALACTAAAVVALRLDAREPSRTHEDGEDAARLTEAGSARADGRTPTLEVLWRVKTSCFATFSYGYFQSSVVLFLPLYLVAAKGVPRERTILVTAFFAAGMLAMSTSVSRLGDRHGHLLVMRILGAVGAAMVASFVLLPSFELMCAAVFVAGATLAAISPVSLALQGVVTERRDLERANGLYNASYAAGMLIGPPISGLLFTRSGGATMLLHLAALWVAFVVLTVVFAKDDPRARSAAVPRDRAGS
jgi:MFS family permease